MAYQTEEFMKRRGFLKFFGGAVLGVVVATRTALPEFIGAIVDLPLPANSYSNAPRGLLLHLPPGQMNSDVFAIWQGIKDDASRLVGAIDLQ